MVTKTYAAEHTEEYLGRDVQLTADEDIKINTKSDLAQIRYDNNLKQAIIHRLKTGIGELELHPNYGSRLFELIGTAPNKLTLQIARAHVKESLLQEPRIAEILRIRPSWADERLKTVIEVDIEVKPIETEETLNLIYEIFI